MGSPSRLAWAILLLGGVVLILSGAASIAVGLLNPGLISSRLPPDAAVDAVAGEQTPAGAPPLVEQGRVERGRPRAYLPPQPGLFDEPRE